MLISVKPKNKDGASKLILLINLAMKGSKYLFFFQNETSLCLLSNDVGEGHVLV